VVIGPRWLESASGQRWLDDPGDFVRLEIETALTRGVGVIPVLVGGVQMPPTTALPKTLAKLGHLNAARVRDDPDFTADVGRLGDAIARYVPRTASPAAAMRARLTAPARTADAQPKPASTATQRRLSPRLVVVGILVLAAIIGALIVLPPWLTPRTTFDLYDVTGTWHLTETLAGGQTADHTLVLHQTLSYNVTGTISASPNLSMPVTGDVTEPQGGWRFDGQFQESINAYTTCEADFDANLSDSSHMVQGTFSAITDAGMCADFGTQFPSGATFTAIKTG
jgi:hypothetical protein